MFPRHSVYIIGPKRATPVKIGYARNVESRLGNLQTGTHEELRIWYQAESLTLPEAKRIEREVHKELRSFWIRGEWFDVHLEDAAKSVWHKINGQVAAARILMRFDTRPFMAAEQYEQVRQVALRTIHNNAIR